MFWAPNLTAKGSKLREKKKSFKTQICETKYFFSFILKVGLLVKMVKVNGRPFHIIVLIYKMIKVYIYMNHHFCYNWAKARDSLKMNRKGVISKLFLSRKTSEV